MIHHSIVLGLMGIFNLNMITNTIEYSFNCLLVETSVGVTCVYTPKGLAVQIIIPDKLWQSKHIPELDEYFFGHMLPE